MSEDWNTKYGTRRVRRDPPTLEEAIFAAVGITDDQEAQAEIASALMGLPLRTGARRGEEDQPRRGAIGHPRNHRRARRAALRRGRAPRDKALRQRQAHRHLRLWRSSPRGHSHDWNRIERDDLESHPLIFSLSMIASENRRPIRLPAGYPQQHPPIGAIEVRDRRAWPRPA